jgi:hypothetical protein
MSARVAPLPAARFCRLIAEFDESLMVARFRAQSRGKGKGLNMKCGFAITLRLAVASFALGAGIHGGFAQQMPAPAVCSQFQVLSDATQKKADAVQVAMKNKVDRKQICTLMTIFVAAEGTLVKFLDDNKTWCGVPDQALAVSKANHEKSQKFRTVVCSDDEPHTKPPSLSDAIKTPDVDSAGHTKTGRYGTFDSLTGNPLGK